MNTNLFTKYATTIRHFNGDPRASALHIASEGPLSVYYAPIE